MCVKLCKHEGNVVTCCLQVNRLRGQPQSLWDMKSVREVLQLSGINMAALLERHEVMTACQQQLDKMPKPVGMAALTPSTCTLATGDADSALTFQMPVYYTYCRYYC